MVSERPKIGPLRNRQKILLLLPAPHLLTKLVFPHMIEHYMKIQILMTLRKKLRRNQQRASLKVLSSISPNLGTFRWIYWTRRRCHRSLHPNQRNSTENQSNRVSKLEMVNWSSRKAMTMMMIF